MQYTRILLLSASVLFHLLTASAQSRLQSPNEFLPHRIGDQFTPHHLINSYFEYLAAGATQTMRVEKYGRTNEARPLQVAYFSAPENLVRLEQIRLNNLRLAGLGDGKPGDATNAPAIVWISMSVHGNESSGSECSMLLAFQLATQTDPKIREWLKNTVVVVDPSLNPDGLDRYAHWSRMSSNFLTTPNPDSREHREPWPGGRTNHYYHDLNRDWVWATQVETQQRLLIYQRCLPHIHADLHEQSIDDPYYFAPAAEPTHAYITPWQRDMQEQIGKNHAQYFDEKGWLYFTKEVFDLLYPSYGDTYPMFSGAIGMTYEQAGNGMAGRAIRTSNGDTLTLYDRVMHHLTTSLSTIEVASKNAPKVLENFKDYFARATTNPPGEYGAFVIKGSNNPNAIRSLCQLLDKHQIKYGLAGVSNAGQKGFDYRNNKESNFNLEPTDIVISTYQPRGVLTEVLFEPVTYVSDSLTYDITAWSLPLVYGLEAYAVKRLEPKQAYTLYTAPQNMVAALPFAWCVHRGSLAEQLFAAKLLKKGVKIRYAREPFGVADQKFEAGAFIVLQADNKDIISQLSTLVQEAAVQSNVQMFPVYSGFAGRGADLGSSKFELIQPPSVAIVYGEEVDRNAFGHTWFFLEKELGYPVVAVPSEELTDVKLSNFNTLIFPSGRYSLDDDELQLIQNWVKSGGKLIAYDMAVRAFAGKEGFDLKLKIEPKKEVIVGAPPKPYQNSERESISDQMPGAIVKAQTDPTHPLAFGLGASYFSLKTSPSPYEMPSNGASSGIWIGDQLEQYGFIGSRVLPRLKNTPIASLQSMGEGSVIFLYDDPLFRSFWYQGKILFANALFH